MASIKQPLTQTMSSPMQNMLQEQATERINTLLIKRVSNSFSQISNSVHGDYP